MKRRVREPLIQVRTDFEVASWRQDAQGFVFDAWTAADGAQALSAADISESSLGGIPMRALWPRNL